MRASEAYLHGVDVVVAPGESTDLDALFDEVSRSLAQPEKQKALPPPQQMHSRPNKDGGRTVDGGGPPIGGALIPFEAPMRPIERKTVKSEIENVSDDAWTRFTTLMRTASYGDVSATGALGAWEMRPKRLGDLKLMENVRQAAGSSGRAAWRGDFVGSLTQRKFLESTEVQYLAFAASMRRYAEGIASGEIARGETDDLTLSGMLAILHRAGPRGLKNWGDRRRRFTDTVDLVDKVNGVF